MTSRLNNKQKSRFKKIYKIIPVDLRKIGSRIKKKYGIFQSFFKFWNPVTFERSEIRPNGLNYV